MGRVGTPHRAARSLKLDRPGETIYQQRRPISVLAGTLQRGIADRLADRVTQLMAATQ